MMLDKEWIKSLGRKEKGCHGKILVVLIVHPEDKMKLVGVGIVRPAGTET